MNEHGEQLYAQRPRGSNSDTMVVKTKPSAGHKNTKSMGYLEVYIQVRGRDID